MCYYVSGGWACIFSVAAVDRAPQAAHERGHFGSRRELPAGPRFYKPDTLDAANRCGFGPFPFPHMGFGVIERGALF
jgi:hypothetical protein